MQLDELQFCEMSHFLIRHMVSKKWRNATWRNAPPKFNSKYFFYLLH